MISRQKFFAGLPALSGLGLAFFLTFLPALPLLPGFQPCGLKLATAAPLLQEGRKTIYQRVISHPGARILASPAANAPVVRGQVVPFTVFYVHARKKGWIQVGPLTGEPEGWIAADRATDWNQSLTLLFTPRTDRDPVLFFRSVADLDRLCAADDMKDRLAKLNDALASNGNKVDPARSAVVATEPAESQGAVSSRRFYLMPILDMKDPYQGLKFLKVASIDPGDGGTGGNNSGNGQAAGGQIPPKTGIALVIDTTISMKPYIDQSLNVVRKIYDRIEKEGLTDSVGFAVVAFRNSTKATPGLEYETKVVSDFATAKDRKSLESRLAQVRQASVSSHDFNEDSLAGVRTAVESLSWDGYASRLVLLISDAGPLKSDDRHATSGMGVSEVSDLARQKGIWVTILHVKSPRGQANHAYAEQSYRTLGRRSDNHSNYLAVKAPSPDEGARQFGSVAQTLANGMLKMVKDTAEGRIMTRPTDEALAAGKQKAPQAGSEDAEDAEAARLAATLGYAMQLEYLGKLRANRAPTVVSSWIADMDLAKMAANEQVPSVEVAVLLTKNQLNDLAAQLRTIIDNAERTKKTDSRDFFQGILSASARMARDPNMPTSGKSLAELGILGEFLEGLPYKSDIMLLREEDWYRMSIGEQTAFVNRLKSRLARYDAYDQDRANWESFGQQNSGDWVYRVPLNMLP